ncbi:MAG: hypothetical protein NVS2B16_25780 [Chloroflexota bacterium]
MKRLVPILVLLAGTTSIAQASTAQPVARPGMTHALATQLLQDSRLPQKSSSLFRGLTALARVRPSHRGQTRQTEAISHSSSHASGSDLALPDSVIAQNGVQGPVASGNGPYSAFHHSYAGYQSGVAAIFDLKPIATLFYQGSAFSDATSAGAYMTEGIAYAQEGVNAKPTDCSSTFNVPCQIGGFTTTTGNLVIYSVAQVNTCVAEVAYQGTSDQITAHSDALNKAAASILVLAIEQAKKACAGSGTVPGPQLQPSISIDQVGLAHQVAGKTQATHVLKGKEKGLFLAVYHASNMGTSIATGTLTFLKGTSTLASIPMQSQTLPDGTTVFGAVQGFKAGKKALHLVAQFDLSVGASKDTRTLTFTVKARKK